jgi:hypothetical protein
MPTNLYIRRERNAAGSAANFHVFVDGNKAGEIANNQTELFTIPHGSHEVHVKLWTGNSSPVLQLDAQNDKTIFLSCGFSIWGKMFLKEEPLPIISNSQDQRSEAEVFSAMQKRLNLDQQIHQGLNWFYVISGLSIINSLMYLLEIPLTFVIGLALTQFVDGAISVIARGLSEGTQTFAYLAGFVINSLIAGIFIVAGILGQKRHIWAVVSGMLLYTLDGVIFLLVGGWLAACFHALALWNMWQGLQALKRLREFENIHVHPEKKD